MSRMARVESRSTISTRRFRDTHKKDGWHRIFRSLITSSVSGMLDAIYGTLATLMGLRYCISHGRSRPWPSSVTHSQPPMVTSGWERARIPRVVRPWLDLRSGWDVRVGSARVGSTCMCHCGGCSIRYKGHDQRNCYSGHHDPIEGRIAFRWRPVFLLFVSCWQLLVQQTALCAHLAAFVD